jgi:hypothetical protein
LPATNPKRCTRVEFPPPGLYEQSFGLIPPDSYRFQVSILRTSQLVLETGLDYNNLSVRTHEKPPYASFGSSWRPFIASRLCYCIVVQCTSSITAPKKAPPVLPPAVIWELALRNWGILFRAAVHRHAEEVRRWVHRWVADEAVHRRIHELPVAAQAA